MIAARALACLLGTCLASGEASAQLAFALADRPGEAEYAPARASSYNASGGAITVAREAEGRYSVRFSGLGQLGSNGDQAREEGQDSGDGTGAVPLPTPPASQILSGVTESPETADPQIPQISERAVPEIAPLELPELAIGEPERDDAAPAGSRGHVQVTAHGPDRTTCKVESWDASGFDVAVRCFHADGEFADSAFTILAGWFGNARPMGFTEPLQLTLEEEEMLFSIVRELRRDINEIRDELSDGSP